MARVLAAWCALALVACGGSEGETLFEANEANEARDAGLDSADSEDTAINDDSDAGQGGSGGGERVCAPGKVEACACPGGGQGAQACRDDGAGYDDCFCKDDEGTAEVPGWEWFCNKTPEHSCMCTYAAQGDRNLNGCPVELRCCVRLDVGSKPSQCYCYENDDDWSCSRVAEKEGGTVVTQCPPQ